MADCNNVLITKIENTEARPNAEERKQSVYDPSMITDEMLTNLFTNENDAAIQYEALYGAANPMIPYKSAQDNSSALKFFSYDKMPFGEVVGVVTDGREIRDLTIAISHLVAAQSSERDVAGNIGATETDLQAVIDPETGAFVTGYDNMARTIGRDILKTMGYRLVPKNAEGMEAALKYEVAVGEQALQELKKREIITVATGHVLNRGFHKESPKSSRDARYEPGNKVISNVKTIVLRPILKTAEEGKSLSSADVKVNSKIVQKLSATRRLINPPNVSNPYTDAQDLDEKHQDLNMMDRDKSTTEKVQANPLKIKGMGVDMMNELIEMITAGKGTSTVNTLKNLAKYVTDTKGSPFLFGTLDPKELDELMMGDPTGIEQQYGKSQAKVAQFARIMDDWDNLQDDIFYTYQIAVQNRAHVVQQTLSYQADNFLSRHLLGTPNEQVLDSDEKKSYLIAYVMDETGLSLDAMLKEGVSPELDDFISIIDDYKDNGKGSSLDAVFEMAESLDANHTGVMPKPMMSAWEMFSYVSAIRDIRKGIHTGTDIKTHFMPKPDATASGAKLTTDQTARYGGKAVDILERLDDEKDSFSDMYTLATDVIQEEMKAYTKRKGTSRGLTATKDAKIFRIIEALTAEKTGVVPNVRELIKLPFTKFIYGQEDGNNAVEIAKELATMMIDTNNVGLMKELMPEGEALPDTTAERRLRIIEVLSEKNGATAHLVSIVSKEIGGVFKEQVDTLSSMHKLMEEAVYDQNSSYDGISVIPPLAAIQAKGDLDNVKEYAKVRREFGTSIDKYFESIAEREGTSLISVKRRYPNKNSILVLLQHMTDAAIMFESLDAFFEEYPDYKNGLMLNHDSIGSDVTSAMAMERIYKKANTKVSSEFDFIEAALRELRYARSLVLGSDAEKTSLLAALTLERDDLVRKSDVLAEKIADDREANNPVPYGESIPRTQEEDTDLSKEMRRQIGVNYGEITKLDREIEAMASREPSPDLAKQMDKKISETEAVLPAQILTKQHALEGKSNDAAFGIKPALLKSVNEADFDAYKTTSKPKKQKTQKQPSKLTTDKLITANAVDIKQVEGRIAQIDKKKIRKLTEEALAKNPNVKVVLSDKNSYDLGSNTVYLTDTATDEQVAHELIHAATAQKIEDSPAYKKKVQKLYDKALNEMPDLMAQFEKLPDGDRLHEFMASGLTNKAMRKSMKKIPVGRVIIAAVKRLTLQALGFSSGSTNTLFDELLAAFDAADYNDFKTNPEKSFSFIDVISGEYKPYKPKDLAPSGVTGQLEKVAGVFDTIDSKGAEIIQKTIDLTIDVTVGSSTAEELHKKAMKSKVYRDTFNAITNQWANNTFIGKMKFYLDLDPKAQRAAFNKLSTQATHAEERKAQFETDKMNSLYKKINGMFTKRETATLYSVLGEVPIANLAKDDILKRIMKEEVTIEQAIDEVLAASTFPTRTKNYLDSRAKELAGLYIDKKAPKGLRTDADRTLDQRELVGQLSALYSLQKVPETKSLFSKILGDKKRTSMMNDLLELATATKTLDDELYGTIEMNLDTHSGNFNHQVFKDNIQIKHVNMKTVNTALREDLGWKVLIKPTESQAGVIYRDAGDITFQSGLGTALQTDPNLNLQISDKYNTEKNNAIPNLQGQTQTVIFTPEQLDEMGLIRDPIPSLVKAYSHRMLLMETQAIRSEIVGKFTYDYESVGEKKILKDIENGEHNWYIKLPDHVTLADVDPKILDKYKATRSTSDADGFSDKITLVREDMADFIEGYGEIQIGGVNTKLNKAFSVLKKMILLQKIHWVIVAPVKLSLDAISNAAYLLSRNIPISTMYKKTIQINNEMADFTQLREDLLHAEFRNRANPSKAEQRRIDMLEKKIENHRLASAYFRGFIQSIAIDLTKKNEHTAAGLQKDTAKILDWLFKDDDASLNMAGEAIMKLSKSLVNGEDLLLSLADKLDTGDRSSTAKAVAKTLSEIAENIQHHKTNDDIAAYLQEFMATPGSGLVTIGSVLIQRPDVISKVILQEFLVDSAVRDYKMSHNGRGPTKEELVKINEDASLEALTSFIDYKVNVPRELRFLEQTGITSFISFWARIQKVMLVSLRNNPVNALTTIMINEMLNVGGGTIFDASVIDKWGSGSLLGGPTPGMDVIFPTKLFG